jgi:glycine dehydrogenase
MHTARDPSLLDPSDTFVRRHVGPSEDDLRAMLEVVGVPSLDALIDETVPASIRLETPLALDTDLSAHGEAGVLAALRAIAGKNKVFRSYLGMGYHGTLVPAVIQRNVLEDPGWYTQYTPYQAEISQGRLEALLTFQTMVSDLTGLPLAGASLLDEGTAAAEAMAMCLSIAGGRDSPRKTFFVVDTCHPQTIAVVQTRAESLGVTVVRGSLAALDPWLTPGTTLCGVLLQYPDTHGAVLDHRALAGRVHAVGAQLVVATDLLALALLTPPGEWGADIAVGNSQRFGVPMGYGGPHAGFLATRTEHARRMPGRIIGVSRDVHGDPAYRMAIQTREQHIRREKATSNICTAQALLAIMAGFYAVYHGPSGIRRIAERVHALAVALAEGVRRLGHGVPQHAFFDTLRIEVAGGASGAVLAEALRRGINLRDYGDGSVGVSLDETVTRADVADLFACFNVSGGFAAPPFTVDGVFAESATTLPVALTRTSPYLTHPVFNRYHSETELLRYITRLRNRDLSLAHAMIPLGSCTMKLNATTEMLPVSWPEFNALHPFVPSDQAAGYAQLFDELERWLCAITGFAAVSLQPNAGSQGEFAGLKVIRAYHRSRGEGHRDVCLIPDSAHGTNPASAAIAGMRVVPVKCDERGNVDLADLEARAAEHASHLACVMVTYPSTHGVFEEGIRTLCEVVHRHGGQVYMDGANLNAQVGLTSPGHIGADVCHVNLHKTFCIPHGGGGPGMGPIGVASHLVPFLPTHPVVAPRSAGAQAIGPVASAPYGSPSILTISWVYIALMGAAGLTQATRLAILNANYMAARLAPHYPVLYTGSRGRVAHEFILDLRPFEKKSGVKAEDVAKRLMDYGFHAPTMSFPVPGTLMIEPTESESKRELDRLCDALIAIREEIRAIEEGRMSRTDNPLKNAPHTAVSLVGAWEHPYTREQAVYPAPWVRDGKFWPPVGRIDNPWGDRNLSCTCPPMSEYSR